MRFLGLNINDDESVIKDGELSEALNILINEDGSIEKRPGIIEYADLGDSPVDVYTYAKSNGTTYFIASHETSVLYSTDCVNFSLLIDGLTGGLEMCFVTISDTIGNDTMVFCNGTDYRFGWDGTTLNTFTSSEQVKPKIMEFHNGRLFAVDSGTYPTRLYYSPFFFGDSLTNYAYLDIPIPSGENITALKRLTRLADDINSYLLIFSQTTTWGLKGTAIGFSSLYPFFSELGSLSHYANTNIEGLQQIPTGVGIYAFSGNSLQNIGRNIYKEYKEVTQVAQSKGTFKIENKAEWLSGETFTNIDTTTINTGVRYGGTFGFRDGWNMSGFSRQSIYGSYDGSIALYRDISNVSIRLTVFSDTGSILTTKSEVIPYPEYYNKWYKASININTFTNQAIKFQYDYQTLEGYSCTSPLFITNNDTLSIYILIDGATPKTLVDAFRPETATYISGTHNTGFDTVYFTSAMTLTTTNGGTIVADIRYAETESGLSYASWNRLNTSTAPTFVGKKWLQYRIQLATPETATLPIVYSISLDYSNRRTGGKSMQGIWWDDYYMLACATEDTSVNNVIYALNKRNEQWTKFDEWNVRRWTVFKNNLYFGSALDDGKIYRAWVTYSDNGESITSYATTKAFDYGDPYHKKRIDRIRTQCDASVNYPVIIASVYTDNSLNNTYTISLHDTSTNKVISNKKNAGEGRNLKYRFFNNERDRNFKIYNFSIEGTYLDSD